jgi:hypothetical protein
MNEQSWTTGFPLEAYELEILGGITALGALIDAVAEGILARLVSDADWQSVMVLTAGQPISWRLDRIKGANAQSSVGSPEYTTWASTARAATEKRNAVVHAAWIARHEEFGAVAHRSRNSGPAFDFHTRQDLEAVRDELRAVYDEGVSLANRLHKETPGGEVAPQLGSPHEAQASESS